MARSLYAAEKGLRLLKENTDKAANNAIDFIFDPGAPVGTSGETDDAEIGSVYSNTTDGGIWKKIASTSSASDWIELGTADEARKQLTGVVAAAQILDSVLVDNILASEWEVHMRDDAVPAKVKVIKILAIHNGEPATDATAVDQHAVAKLKIGAAFTATLNVELNGATTAQVMRLSVVGQVGGVTFTSRRTDIKAP